MLIATPYRDFDVRDRSPPRIISEIRKNYVNCTPANFRPKLTGDLLLKCGMERSWWPRRVSIRCGQLMVSTAHGEEGPTSLKLPLRHLSLRAGALPNSLSLVRGQNVVLTLQACSQRSFDEWVKAIAIELIRQTPLDAIKYLDILTIAECWKRREENYEKDWNFNNCSPDTNNVIDDNCNSCNTQNQKITSQNLIAARPNESPPKKIVVEEKRVEDLIKRCQNGENYVPVKEKLFLFESLCKLDRKVRSTEDVSTKIETGTKRARSLHDLSQISTHIAVREICKYFENKCDLPHDNTVVNFRARRPINSDSQLIKEYEFRKVLTT